MKASVLRRREDGFVLALTLWVLVAVLITATFFAGRVQRAVSLASDFRAATDAEVEMASARADILQRLATTSLTVFGSGSGEAAFTIRLDDRPYRTGPVTEISLQDARGLINVNLVDTETLERLLAAYGIGQTEADHLADTLGDYIDDDSLRRLNGAEAPEYLAAHLAPPRNAPLLSTRELRRVMGWRDHPELLDDPSFMDLLTAGETSGLNPNTAPAAVLRTLPNVTPELAAAIVAARNGQPYPSSAMFASVIGADAAFSMTHLNAFPSTSMRVTQRVPGRGWALRYDVELLPFGEAAPWRIEHVLRVERANAPVPDATDAADAVDASRAPPDGSTPQPTAVPALPQRPSDAVIDRS
jgi:type II secretory pathway component PulK